MLMQQSRFYPYGIVCSLSGQGQLWQAASARARAPSSALLVGAAVVAVAVAVAVVQK